MEVPPIESVTFLSTHIKAARGSGKSTPKRHEVIDVSDSVTINRPVEDVFNYVTDMSNDPSWHTDVLEARKTSEGPVGVGTTWHSRFKPSMGVSEGAMEVVALEPNRMEVLRGAIGPMQPTLTYMLEPIDGGTRFTRRIQIKVSE